jgi:hypothetical protein
MKKHLQLRICNNQRFEIREPVKVYTKFYPWQTKFWLPDEVLYFGNYDFAEKGTSIILWHGSTHIVKTKDIHKIKE